MNVAITSVFAAVFLTAIKLIFALLTGSLGLLSEFAHSGLDFLAAIVTVFSIKISSRPADDKHHYGFGKIENLSAIAQVIILFVTCGYIIYEAVSRLFFKVDYHLQITPWAYLVMVISILVDVSRSRLLMKVAKETHSQALEADALHFQTDIWSSAVVILGLLLVGFNISKEADAVAALLVSVFVIYVSVSLLRRATGQLMDRVPEGLYDEIINGVSKIEGVENVRQLRLRESGPNTFVDMTISISRTLPFQKAHEIMDDVEKKILEIKNTCDITIHSEPIVADNETMIDKARFIVNNNGLKCHDIYTYELDKENYIELDVEYETNDNFVDAHNRVTKIEKDILEEVKGVNKVRIHIDEPGDLIMRSEDVTKENEFLIKQIQKVISFYEDVKDSLDVNVIKSNNTLRVSMTCVFPEEYDFSKVHRLVHKIENEIYLLSDNISNVVIHAEPAHNQ
jgi:cation diffusion facilitator family transporter